MGGPLSQVPRRRAAEAAETLRKFVDLGLGLYALLACLGLFIRPGLTGSQLSLVALYCWIAGYLVLLFRTSYEFVFSDSPILPVPFRFVALGVIFVNFIMQLTGGVHSTFWPAYYLFAVVFSALSRLPQAALMVLSILSIELASLVITRQFDAARWQSYAGFSLSLAGVSLATSSIMGYVQRGADQVKDAHDRLIEKAEAVNPLADPAKLEALMPQSRQAANLRTAQDREESFSALLGMAFQFVPAPTYVLLVNEGREHKDAFVLRAVKTVRSRDVLPIGTVLDPASGKTHINLCADTRMARYLPDLANTSGPLLGYYRPDARLDPVRSAVIIPVLSTDGEKVVAVLAADAEAPDAFDEKQQETLKGFSAFFLDIIEKTQIALELENKAAHFGALHDISTDLNRGLEFGEIMMRVIPRMKTVIPFDYGLCLLARTTDGTNEAQVIAADGYEHGAVGSSFPIGNSTVLAFMHKHWLEQGTTTFYTADYGDRSKDIDHFPLRDLQKPVRSLYGRLFVANGEFLGAVFLGSKQPDAFTSYHREYLLDTLLNQVALVAYNARLHRQIETMARTDGLTGLLNHRTFMEMLHAKYRELERIPRPFSILLMDIDKFKGVNDKYGHPIGDIAIKAVARILQETIRGTDFVARYGGEEFAVGMVETDRKGAEQMAERVRSLMERTVVTKVFDGELKCTLSIGVATFPEDTRDSKDLANLVTYADDALYHAKRSGRNRVCLFRDAAKSSMQAVQS
jgi:diguanylate cyclase (GGDEF)-like protein